MVSISHPVHFLLHSFELVLQFSVPLSQVLFPPRWWRHEGNVLNRSLRRGDELSRPGICRVGSRWTDRSKQTSSPNLRSRRRCRYRSWLLLLRSLYLRVLLISSARAARRSLPISILYRLTMCNGLCMLRVVSLVEERVLKLGTLWLIARKTDLSKLESDF